MPCRRGPALLAGRWPFPYASLVALASVLLISACNILAPQPDINVAVTTEAHPYIRTDDASGAPYVLCGLDVTVTATGDKGAHAEWGDATAALFAGTDDSVPIAKITGSAWEVKKAFGSQSIEPGMEQQMSWDLSAPVPFRVRFQQQYTAQPAGETRTAGADVQCGPAPRPGSLPAIDTLALSSETPEAGKDIVTHYHIRSERGLWAVRMELSSGSWSEGGMLDVTQGATEVVDTATTFLPYSMGIGHPLSVRVIVTDMAGQVTERTVQSANAVADLSPPWIILANPCHPTCRAGVGDTFVQDGSVSDASDISIIYRVGSPALIDDTATLGPGEHGLRLAFPLDVPQPGTYPVFVRFVDALGHSTADNKVADVTVYPVAQGDTLSTRVAGAVTDLRIDEPRGKLYAARPDSNDVLVLGLSDLRRLSRIPLDGGPYGLDLSVSGDSLLVALADSQAVAIVDPDGVRPATLVKLDSLQTGFRPLSIRVEARGRWLVHAERLNTSPVYYADDVLLEYRPDTGGQEVLETGSRRTPHGRMVASDDHRRILTAVECLRVYDGVTGARTGCEYGYAHEMATDAAGDIFASPTMFLDASAVIQAKWISDYDTNAMDLTPDGRRLLAVRGDRIEVVGSPDDSFPGLRIRGAFPSGRFQVSPSGTIGIGWGDGDLDYRVPPDSTAITRINLQPVLDLMK